MDDARVNGYRVSALVRDTRDARVDIDRLINEAAARYAMRRRQARRRRIGRAMLMAAVFAACAAMGWFFSARVGLG